MRDLKSASRGSTFPYFIGVPLADGGIKHNGTVKYACENFEKNVGIKSEYIYFIDSIWILIGPFL